MIAAEEKRRTIEASVQDKEALRARLETQQYEVKSNEAYTTILAEIEAAKEAIDGFETEELEAMEVVDAARAELAQLQQQLMLPLPLPRRPRS